MRDSTFYYSEKSKDASTSHVQIEDDKVKASIETKCPVCQEYSHIQGLTDAFDLHIKEDILILTDKSFRVGTTDNMRSPKDAFKIKYCPFCGREL
jgi:hypothetical protein